MRTLARAATSSLAVFGAALALAAVAVAVIGITPDRLERLADAARYVAKRPGRNRVELADAPPAGPPPAGPPRMARPPRWPGRARRTGLTGAAPR